MTTTYATMVKTFEANFRHRLNSATQDELASGAAWYRIAHNGAARLAHDYALTLEQAAACIAALSPRNKWESNIINARDLARAYATGRDADSVKVSTFGANKAKAWRALSGDTDAVTGDKVRAFMLNILDPDGHEHVTLDGHMMAAGWGKDYTIERAHSETSLIERRAMRQALKRLASKRRINGQAMTPAQVQAIIWLVQKRIVGR